MLLSGDNIHYFGKRDAGNTIFCGNTARLNSKRPKSGVISLPDGKELSKLFSHTQIHDVHRDWWISTFCMLHRRQRIGSRKYIGCCNPCCRCTDVQVSHVSKVLGPTHTSLPYFVWKMLNPGKKDFLIYYFILKLEQMSLH